MVHNFQNRLSAPVIELQSIDSTNNYAMQLIDADKAQGGLTIITQEQASGRGQRGHNWQSVKGENLLMSIVLVPSLPIERQFLFNMSIAVATCNALRKITDNNCCIKWPNDLIINDRKAGGILIENIIRGNNWVYSIVGVGINVLQTDFPDSLPFATSLKREGYDTNDVHEFAFVIRKEIIEMLSHSMFSNHQQYNQWLYKRGNSQAFSLNGKAFTASITEVLENGELVLQTENNETLHFQHGSIEWIWQ